MRNYRIDLTPDDNGTFLVTCRALPEVNTFGGDEADAIAHAQDAIEEALAARMARGLDLPDVDSSRAPDGGRILFARIPALTELKTGLYSALRAAGVTRAELARRLGWNRNSVDRLFLLDHASRLDQIETAAAALGLAVRAELTSQREPA